MNPELKKIINLIWLRDKEDQAIELINSLITNKDQQIIKNPRFKTFNEYIKINNIIIEDDSQFSWWHDMYLNEFDFKKDMWPYIFNNQYYITAETVMLAFFRKYPRLRSEFMKKQNLVVLGN